MPGNKIRSILLTGLLLSAAPLALAEDKTATQNTLLINAHEDIMEEFDSVRHINADGLVARPATDYVLFDVREKKEFAVSHLQDAIQIDPDISAKDFATTYADQIKGKTVVLYCSIGYRSSRLAERLGDQTGAVDIYSLENGIFGWHNESRPLFSGQQQTDFVHPFSFFREWMLNRRDLKRYKPE